MRSVVISKYADTTIVNRNPKIPRISFVSRLCAACSSVDKWWSMAVSKFPRSKYGAIGRKTGPTREDGSFPARDAENAPSRQQTRGRQRGSRLRA